MYRKLIATGVLAGAVTLALASPALAYDCYNASRGAQGNAGAANAGTWWDVPEILHELGGLTDAQVAKVMPVVNADARIPANFTVFFNPAHPAELAANMNEKNATNGTGIDHSDDYSTPVLQAIFQDVAIALS
jgi:hypothetical protein